MGLYPRRKPWFDDDAKIEIDKGIQRYHDTENRYFLMITCVKCFTTVWYLQMIDRQSEATFSPLKVYDYEKDFSMVETLMIKTFGFAVFLMVIKQAFIYLSEKGAPYGIGFKDYNPEKEHPSFSIEEQRKIVRQMLAKRIYLVKFIHEKVNGDNTFKGIEGIPWRTVENWLDEMNDQNLGGHTFNVDKLDNE